MAANMLVEEVEMEEKEFNKTVKPDVQDPELIPPEVETEKSAQPISNTLEMERSMLTKLWYGVAAAAICLNLAAMVIEGPIMAIVSGLVALAVAPAVIYSQFKLEGTDTLRMVHNQLRKEATRLMADNLKLSSEVTRLEGQVGRLKEQEAKLASISKENGVNVDTLVNLVKQNKVTLEGLKSAVKAELSQILVTAVLDSDMDSSGHFSDDEIEVLSLRLSNVSGVKVNLELLEKTAKGSDRTLNSILELLDHLDRNDLMDEQRIFQLDETNLPGHT